MFNTNRLLVWIAVAALFLGGGLLFFGGTHGLLKPSPLSNAGSLPVQGNRPADPAAATAETEAQGKPGAAQDAQGDKEGIVDKSETPSSENPTPKDGKATLATGQDDSSQDRLAKFPVIDQEVRDLSNNRQLHVSLYDKGVSSFTLIKRTEESVSDGKGGISRVCRKEVGGGHLVLTASSMDERKQIKADLIRAGWTCTHKAPTEPWMLVHLSGRSLKALAESKAALEKLIPASAKLTEDGVSWAAVIPNDPSYGTTGLYGVTKVQANKAWDIADAAGDVLIGVIDSGVDYTHPDLAANIWTNKMEIPSNGIDDDSNGYVDDIIGWNFCTWETNLPPNQPMDMNGHGSHVSGTAAAVGFNNLGVIGVAPRAKIIACQYLDRTGGGLNSHMALAQAYLLALRQRGEFVAAENLSVGMSSYPYVMGGSADQVACSNGIVVCFAAGNNSTNDPGNYTGTANTPNILYVANTDSSDNLWSTSNRGYDWCDLSAPGASVNSTKPNNTYGSMTGTSMATPHVAGAAAMVASVNRSLTAYQTMHIITSSVDRVTALQSCTMSGGRLNVYKAVLMAKTYPDVALIAPSQNGTLARNQAVTLVASVKITSNTVTAVRFYRGGTTLIGTDNSASGGWTCPWTPSTTGTYDLTCEADDNAGHTTRTWWRTRVTVASSAPAPVVGVITTDNFGSELGDDGKFAVQLSSPFASNLTIPLVVSGTATAGSDYTALPASVVITAGSLCAEVPVTVLNDYTDEEIESVSVTVGAGVGYTVGAASNATVWIHDDESEAPAIVFADPTNVIASVGGGATFAVSAGGKAPLSYQWRKNSTIIPAATASTFTLASVVPADVGLYSCTVSNKYGVDTSAGAALTLMPVSPIPASNIQPNSAKLNAYLSLSNNTVDIYAYWNTVDGGTNAAVWTNAAYVGTWTTAVSNVSHNVAGLMQDTAYFFTFACSNASGRVWADRVLTFTTMGSVAVDNSSGAETTVIGAATLGGALTGGSVGDVYFYWGASDGGTDPRAWANVVVKSNVAQGACSATLSNLLYGMPYYYRCFASNSVGSAWSPGSSSFKTIYGYFSENFDGVTAPGLPAGWTSAGTAAAAWKTKTPTNDTAPNAAFAPDLATTSSNALISPVFLYVTNMGSLIFRHAYYFEGTTTAYDGGVLDIKIGSNPWYDIISAGGSWVGNGYSKTLSTLYSNPLGGRSAWGADSAGFVTTTVKLPASAANQNVQLRWMIGTDSSGGDIGWFVDTIRFTVGGGKLQLAPAAATSVTESSATLNGTLSCSSAVMVVYAHWGAVNGGTNVSSWANTAYVGSWTNASSASFSKLVTGLNPFGTYYFTFRGSNACEQTWSTNALSFTTLATPDIPVVDNGQGPTDATLNGCRLNGILGDGGLAEAWICWGDNDAGMSGTGAWGHVVSAGTVSEGVPFGVAVSGLSTNTTYWYRCFVSNGSGSDWSDTAASFSGVPAGGGGVDGVYSMKITFTNFPGRGVLTNFPALVRLTADNTSNYEGFLGTNGYELRFWTNDTFTGQELNYEIEEFNNTSNSYVWVQVPCLTNNCSIWATWGDAARTNQQAYTTSGAVWSAGYYAVWHLRTTNSAVSGLDSGLNKFNGTATGIAVDSGLADGAASFTGGGNYINVPGITGNSPTSFTASAWVKYTSCANSPVIMAQNDSATSKKWAVDISASGYVRLTTFNSAGTGLISQNSVTTSPNEWHHITAIFDASGKSQKLYIDGQQQTLSLDGLTNFYGTVPSLKIGGTGRGAQYTFNGVIDECRLSSGVRSSNWVWACWMNMGQNHDSFVQYGDVVTGSSIPVQNRAPSAITNASAILNAKLVATNDNYDVYVYWGQVDGVSDAGAWTGNSYVGSWTNVASTNISYQVTGLSAGTTYYCTFRATNAATNVWAVPSWQFMTSGTSGGSSNYSLGVVSAHGGASPGSSVSPSGTVFNCSITNSPVTNGSTQYFCTGWTMAGNGPLSGTATNFVMTLTNNATLTWQWKTNYWIELNVAGN